MNEEPKTERQKSVERLQKELTKAARSKHFVNSDEGQYVIEYIGELISAFTNQVLNSRKSHEEYIEIRAKVDVLRKLKQVLEVQSNEEVIAKLAEDLALATSE
jgi:hypothetical protein